jgi:hypothetical protein
MALQQNRRSILNLFNRLEIPRPESPAIVTAQDAKCSQIESKLETTKSITPGRKGFRPSAAAKQ